MPGSIHLRVLTAEGLALEEEAVSIIAPGELGYLGMLFNHAPLVTTLMPGKLSWRQSTGVVRTAQVGTGLLEVFQNHVTLLTDAITR